MERKQWTLLVISEAGSSGLSPIQLQKCLFLIAKNLPSDVGNSFYEFIPYNYGPFDPDVYSDVHALVREGLVEMLRVSGRNWAYYAITPAGKAAASDIKSHGGLRPQALDYVRQVVNWVQSLSFAQLLSAIYQAYPQYKAKSVFVA